jgi:hypothetical protein
MKQSIKFSVTLSVLFVLCNIVTPKLFAQTPSNGIFFQAVARDKFSNPAKDRKIYVQSSIIQSTATGTKVLTEEYQTTTDASGVFSISVGLGTRIGGTASNLTGIDWANGPYFLNLKIAITPIAPTSTWDYKNELIDLGTTPFGVVPYALFAGTANGLDAKLSIKDTTSMLAIYAKAQAVKTLESTVNTKVGATDTAAMLAPYKKMVNEIIASNITSLTADAINTALNSKVNIVDSNKMYVTPSLLAARAFDPTNINNSLALKANTSDVNTSLALKATATDVTTSLGSKANAADVTASLATKVDKVTGKELSTNDYTTAEKTKLAAITGSNTGDQDLSAYATNIKVDQISTDVTSALALKANLASPVFTGTISGITSSMVGLGNVNNTSDASKPISTLTQNALDLKLNAADTSKYTKQTYSDSALLTKLSITGNAATATTAGNITATANTTLTSLSNLATVGTITSGVWSGTAVAVEKGGTGLTSLTSGYVPFGNGTDAFATSSKFKWNNIFDEDGNLESYTLGIGVTDPGQGFNTMLDVGGRASFRINSTNKALIIDGSSGYSRLYTGSLSGTPDDLILATYPHHLNQLFLKQSNGYVGINNNNPIAQLDVNGTIKASGTLTAGDVTYPNTKGTDGQVLTIDGTTGVASWAAVSTGVSSIGSILGASTANGASITSGVLNLAPADATNGGIVTTDPQTIAGAKTFNSNIIANGVSVGRGNGNNDESVAVGSGAMGSSNVNGKRNTAIGSGAMANYNGTSFDNNTSVGYNNLPYLTSGSGNTSVGAESMMANITGTENTSVGNQSLINSTGNNNVGIGKRSGQTISSGSQNTIIGTDADVATNSLNNATAIGYGANVATSNAIQLGNTSITNVKTSGTITADAVTYPKAHGTNGQVLSTTGSGTLAWITPSTTATAYSGTLPVANGGTGVTSSTGTGSVVLSSSPTLVTPNIGTPASGVATNLTGLPLTTGVTGTLPVANGGTGVTSSTGTGSVVLSSSPTFTGTVTSPVYASAPNGLTAGSTITWTPSNGLNASVTLDANSTLAFSAAPPAGSTGTLVVEQGIGAPHTLALPTSGTNKVLGSSTGLTLSTVPNSKDIVTFYYDGSVYYWNVGQGYGSDLTSTSNHLAGGASGVLPYQSASGTTAFTSAGTSGQILTSGGYGSPTWTSTTGTGNVVLSSSPTLVTPNIGTPASGVATNLTGLPLTTGVTGTLPVANGGTGVTSSTGTGNVVLSSSPTLVTPNIGTPTSGVATNLTGLPLTSGVTGILPVANGGTGSSTQNFVDLSNSQTISGTKTFNDYLTIASTTSSSSTTSGAFILAGGAGIGGNVYVGGNVNTAGSLTANTASIGTNSPNANAILDLSSTTKGFLPPRMSFTQRDAISSPPAGLIIWCNNCGSSGEVQVYNGSSWTNIIGGKRSVSVGETYGGGIVAYILQSGDPGYDANVQHGLVAATSDQSSGIRWNNGSNTITGATGTAIGTGLSNTNTVITSQGGTATSYAAGIARAYAGGGYNDWYLPSKDELNKLYLSKSIIGNFALNYYWSSSESAYNGAYVQRFDNGVSQDTWKDYDIIRVRAIRSF